MACYAVISYVVISGSVYADRVGDGIQPLVSFYYGAGNEEVCHYIRKVSRKVLTALGIGFLLLVTAAAPYIPELFGMSVKGARMFVPGMRLSAAAFSVYG